MNKLEQAKEKLNNIKNEQVEVRREIRSEHDRIPFGQPNIIGRKNIYKNLNRFYEKSFKLLEKEKQQENKIEMLESINDFKEANELIKDVHVVGKTAYASIGAKTSVNNIEYFKDQLNTLERENEEAKVYNKTKPAVKRKTLGVKISKLKNKIEMLEKMLEKDKNKILSKKSQELINSGKVTQWQKKPVYYFVKGINKVALELNESGDFTISNRYPAFFEEDKNYIEKLLN